MKKFLKVTVNGTSYDVVVEDVKEEEVNFSKTKSIEEAKKEVKDLPKEEVRNTKSGNIKVTAPMPGNIWKIKTSIGSQVKKHEVLLILEAMKMENEIVSPLDGTVTNILVKEGDAVEPGKIMVELD